MHNQDAMRTVLLIVVIKARVNFGLDKGFSRHARRRECSEHAHSTREADHPCFMVMPSDRPTTDRPAGISGRSDVTSQFLLPTFRGRRPKSIGTINGEVPCRYKLLVYVTDVTVIFPLLH